MTDKLNSSQRAAWLNHLPNILTVLRIIMVPIFIALIIGANQSFFSYKMHSWALVVFCLAAYTDRLDGQLARKWNLISNFGKILDPIADKALMISAFVLLSWFYGLYWWFTFLVIFRELAVTLLRMVLLRRAIVVPASKGGKIKTVLQCLLVFLWMLLVIFADTKAGTVLAWLSLITLVATFVATALSGLVYFLDAWTNYSSQKQAATVGDEEKDKAITDERSSEEKSAEAAAAEAAKKALRENLLANPNRESQSREETVETGSEEAISAEKEAVNEAAAPAAAPLSESQADSEVKKYAPRAQRREEPTAFKLHIPEVNND